MRRFLTLTATCLFLSSLPAICQEKAETRMYEKALANPSIQAFDKFLKKYPASSYAPEIRSKKDTLLNICTVPADIVAREVGRFFPEGSDVRSVGYRYEGDDRFIGMRLEQSSGTVRIVQLQKGKSTWEQTQTFDYPLCDNCLSLSFDQSPSEVNLSGVRYLAFTCDATLHAPYAAFCAALFNPVTMEFKLLTFCGKTLSNGKIEGASDEKVQMGINGAELAYLLSRMEQNPKLVRLGEEDLLTDDAIRWWMDNNSQAVLKSSSSLKFGIIPQDASLVRRFNSARDKQKSQAYTAALFDIRDYTVIVANTGQDYILCWAEPKCRNSNKDRYLNHIYFEKGSTLVLFYYHGKKTYKWRLNLSGKTLTK